MTERKKLKIIFQWHMHQPFYKDALSGEYTMPWTRLHISKDYTDMAWHLQRHPEVKGVINFVPSLLKQIEEYQDFSAVNERHLQLTQKPAESLSDDEKMFLLQEFFTAQFDRILSKSSRYLELFSKRGDNVQTDALKKVLPKFAPRDFRDLQVWFLLAWSGQYLRNMSEVANLVQKDKDFSEEEKQQLLTIHQNATKSVLQMYQDLQTNGQVEISTSPYAHPILPLLIDSEVARISMPGVHLPEHRFRHAEEAGRQIEKALEFTNEHFNKSVNGFWPSEGSVSEAVAQLMAEQNVRWFSTDSNVLARSLSRTGEPAQLSAEQLYRPYRFATDAGDVTIFFRDQILSDLIGFRYASMEPKDAVADFFSHLNRAYEALPNDDSPYAIVVTMDGENAWEHFKDNGRPFFDELYSRLSKSERFQTTTFSEYLDEHPAENELEWLHPGSWIGADFHIWIGQPEKNDAWDALNDALNLVKQKRQNGEEIPPVVDEVLLWAEGSDWFWWYGDYNNSDHDPLFDQLFRNALRKVYQELDEPLPEFLQGPN